jgi:hypothetical protein
MDDDKEEMKAYRKKDKEEMEAKWKTDKEEIKTNQAKLLAIMEAEREEWRVSEERLLEVMNTWQEEMKACQDAIETNPREQADVVDQQKIPNEEEGMMACQDMEAHPEEEEPTSVNRKPEVAQQQDVPVKDTKVMPVGEPKKKRRRDQKLATEHCRQKPKNSTRENCGPQKKLPVARTGTTCHAKVARKTPIDKMSHRATVA